ncbi:MAG: hypothetical protein Kow0063_24570 [Anaerolineae bacterium]
MSKQWFLGLSGLAIVFLLIVGCQSQPTAGEIVARLREVEANTQDVHAVLEISVDTQGQAEDLVIEAWEKKPDKFRAVVLQASDPEYQDAVTVADGRQVWMYQPAKNEVLVGEVGQDGPSSPRDMLRFVDEIVQRALDTSDIKLAGEEEVAGVATYRLELVPTQDEGALLPPGSKATLWVDQERWIILQAHVTGDVVGEGRMSVRSFELNTGLEDGLFQFEIPDGARVTNLEDKHPTSVTLDEARAQADFPLLLPGYLPEGVTLIDVLTLDGAVILYYDHSDTSFSIIQGWPAEEDIPLGQKTSLSLRGQTAELITDDLGNSFLIWTENGVTIVVAGHISQDEVVQVAESLQ